MRTTGFTLRRPLLVIIHAMTGSTVGHYQILERLGEGGMGVVYKARDVLLNRTAALKFLPADSADADEKRRRFVQEAQSASALNHPNIVTIYEVANEGERDFIAMELRRTDRCSMRASSCSRTSGWRSSEPQPRDSWCISGGVSSKGASYEYRPTP